MRQHARGFCIGITTPESLGHLRAWGHRSTIIMDATAGTNKWKFHLTTLMVINKQTGRGIPVAWIIHKYEDAFVIRAALDNLAKKAGGSDDLSECIRNFCPSYMLIDACAKETKAITECAWGKGLYDAGAKEWIVPAAKVMYCLWHVQRQWLKHSKSVSNATLRGAMWAELKNMLHVKAGSCSTHCGTLLQHPDPPSRCAGHHAGWRAVAPHRRVRGAVAHGAGVRQVRAVPE